MSGPFLHEFGQARFFLYLMIAAAMGVWLWISGERMFRLRRWSSVTPPGRIAVYVLAGACVFAGLAVTGDWRVALAAFIVAAMAHGAAEVREFGWRKGLPKGAFSVFYVAMYLASPALWGKTPPDRDSKDVFRSLATIVALFVVVAALLLGIWFVVSR